MTEPKDRPALVEVALRPLRGDWDTQLVANWMTRSHVARWWGDVAQNTQRLVQTPAEEHALITVCDEPVGYLRWQAVRRADLDAVGLVEIPDSAVDADIFLGEPDWLGLGVGPLALFRLQQRLQVEGRYTMLGLFTSVENQGAVRAFEKAGLARLRQYEDPAHGPSWALVASL